MGRPLKYTKVSDMEKDIKKYFNSCFKTVTDENGNKQTVQYRPFTMAGLADALDMSRQSLINYKNKSEYFDTIMRARRKVEVYAEERLYDREGVNGAKFNLINNFSGWSMSDKNEVEFNQKLQLEKLKLEERKVVVLEKSVQEMDSDISYEVEEPDNED